jgi:hypothetical protein
MLKVLVGIRSCVDSDKKAIIIHIRNIFIPFSIFNPKEYKIDIVKLKKEIKCKKESFIITRPNVGYDGIIANININKIITINIYFLNMCCIFVLNTKKMIQKVNHF